jgi:hypothetical protein
MTKPKTPANRTGAREAQRARALKENLRRRKSQARRRASTAKPYPEKTNEPQEAESPKTE